MATREATLAGELVELRTFRSTNLALAPDETTTGYDATTWTYNNRSNLTAKTYADGKGPTYTYTPGGKLLTRTWARTVGGNPLVTTYGYNTAGELVSTDYSDTTPDVTVTFDKLGRQTSVTNGYATSTFSYDSASLALASETVSYDLDRDNTPELTRVIDCSRDSLGRDTGFQLKDNSTVENEASYQYDTATGRLVTVSGGGFQPPSQFSYSYLANSNLIETITGPAHTVTNTYAADRDVLLSKENKTGATTVSKYSYTVNSLGQRTNVAQTGSAFPAATGWNWGYDVLGQVTTAEHATTPANHRAYVYDTIGNRNKSINGNLDPNDSAATTYTTNNLNQYTSIGTVSPINDADGNMTSGQIPAGSAGLVWDAENRLTTVAISGGDTVHYTYDSQSRRIARTVGTDTTIFVYDAWNVIAEYEGSAGVPPALFKTHLWGKDLSGSLQGAGGIGGLLATTSHDGTVTTHFPTYDGNGNISEYLDATGTIIAHFEYDPFGNTVVNTDMENQFSYRFSTKPIDPATGLYYYGYRYYDPLTGRWPGRDPIEEQGGLNLYGFVGNDGVNKWDMLGLDFIAVGSSRALGKHVPGGGHFMLTYWKESISCLRVGDQKYGNASQQPTGWLRGWGIWKTAVSNDATGTFDVIQLGFTSNWELKYTRTLWPFTWTEVDNPDISQINISSSDSDADQYKIIYADTPTTKNAAIKWATIQAAAASYAYAEHGPFATGIVAKNWPNSHYGHLAADGNYNNSNTFAHAMAASIGATIPLGGWGGRFHPGNISPVPVKDTRPAPKYK